MYVLFVHFYASRNFVNPDAGLGGKLGLKGSDGKATEAREAGAEDRAGPRMKNCLSYLESVIAN